MRLRIPILAVAGIAVLWSPRAPFLIWNASASAPIGLYVLHQTVIVARDDLVLAIPPQAAARLATKRGYLPAGVPLVKRVAALASDMICSTRARITINGYWVATRLAADAQNRPLPAWCGCRTLQPGQVFLLMAGVRDSFDGRYFGPIQRSAILGTLRPLWTH